MSNPSSRRCSSVLIYHSCRMKTMTLSLVESCRSFRREGAVLICDCLLADGESYKTSLDQYIGNVGGNLVWHAKGFSETCTDLHLESTILHYKCKKTNSEELIGSSIDLALKLRNDNGVLMQANLLVPWAVEFCTDHLTFQDHGV